MQCRNVVLYTSHVCDHAPPFPIASSPYMPTREPCLGEVALPEHTFQIFELLLLECLLRR